MAKDLDTDNASDDIGDGLFDGGDDVAFDENVPIGGTDNSIRRKIEERLERKRLMEELDLLDDFDI